MSFITPEVYGTNSARFTDRECRDALLKVFTYIGGQDGGRIGKLGREFDLSDEKNRERFGTAVQSAFDVTGLLRRHLDNASPQALEEIARGVSKNEEILGKNYLAGWETRYSPDGLRDAIPKALIEYTNDVRIRALDENNEKFPLPTDKDCMAVLRHVVTLVGGENWGLIGRFGREHDLRDEKNRQKYNAHISTFERNVEELCKYLGGASPEALVEIAELIQRSCELPEGNALVDLTGYSFDELKDMIPKALTSYAGELKQRIEEIQRTTDFKERYAWGEADDKVAGEKGYLKDLQQIIGGSSDIGRIVGILMEKNMLDAENRKMVEGHLEEARDYIALISGYIPEMCDGAIVAIAKKISESKNYNSSDMPLRHMAKQTPFELREKILNALHAQVASIEAKYREVQEIQLRIKLDSCELVKRLPPEEKTRAMNVLRESGQTIYEKNSEIKAKHDELFELAIKAVSSTGLDGREKRELLTEIRNLFTCLDEEKQTTFLAKYLSGNGVDVGRTYDGVLATLSDNIEETVEKISPKVSSLTEGEKVQPQLEVEPSNIIIPEKVLGLFLKELIKSPSDLALATIGYLAEQGVCIAGTPEEIIITSKRPGLIVPYSEKEKGIKAPKAIEDYLLCTLHTDERYTAELILAPTPKLTDVWNKIRTGLVEPAITHAEQVLGVPQIPDEINIDVVPLVTPEMMETAFTSDMEGLENNPPGEFGDRFW